jgi:hypothetical protein
MNQSPLESVYREMSCLCSVTLLPYPRNQELRPAALRLTLSDNLPFRVVSNESSKTSGQISDSKLNASDANYGV